MARPLRPTLATSWPATTRILYVNRQAPPDIIIARVEQMTWGKPFERLDALIDAREFRAITERYKAITVATFA